jgi:hypothetical protein
LEPHIQTEDTPQSRKILEGQLRECYGRVVYTHKAHEKCVDILLSRLNLIKIAQIVLSSLTTAGFIGVLAGKGQVATIGGLVVSTILLILNAYMKNFNIGELAQKHKHAAIDLWLVREEFQSLLVDLAMREKPLVSLQEQRDKLIKRQYSIYNGSPNTTDAAYKKAQKALKKSEDMTFSDEEIDAFLPKELKRTGSAQKVS